MAITVKNNSAAANALNNLNKTSRALSRSFERISSGQRIARSNDRGEREVLDDAARALEQQRLQSVVDTDCKGP